jgi:hypothetical protein
MVVVADAKGNSASWVIERSSEGCSVLNGDEYRCKDEHRISSLVLSPTFSGALLLCRDGRVEFADLSRQPKEFVDVAAGERMQGEIAPLGGSTSMAFTEDGMRAIVVDRSGTVMALEFGLEPVDPKLVGNGEESRIGTMSGSTFMSVVVRDKKQWRI